ncbi:RIP metalloprotease RseP [Patescibacteria group bacterium]|nr:RIP metalloprotease RseP [Patescibacteria group bacterium]
MSILIFIIMLVVLIVGHEFGHLIAAKLSGMKVPEFGIGFPPKLWGKKIGDTEYTINALPFGGFVKIVGEDANEASDDPAAFSNRPKIAQALTLFAGPFANVILGFVFFTLAFMFGIPTAVDDSTYADRLSNERIVIAEVLPGSPAQTAGIHPGDRVISIRANGTETPIENPEIIAGLIAQAQGSVVMTVERQGETLSLEATPITGLIEKEPERQALGIASALVGTLQLPFIEAVAKGFSETVEKTQAIVVGMGQLIASAVTLSADVKNIAGPVGIASLAGDAANFGFGSILSFAALISLNLAVLNLLPFPALDGGRLTFLFVETIIRRPIPSAIANTVNMIGFAILILLMLAVTANDIWKLFA